MDGAQHCIIAGGRGNFGPGFPRPAFGMGGGPGPLHFVPPHGLGFGPRPPLLPPHPALFGRPPADFHAWPDPLQVLYRALLPPADTPSPRRKRHSHLLSAILICRKAALLST
jgi:hypothetical protein